MNVLDQAIAYLAPGWAAKRAQSRQVLSYYEAAAPTKTRKARRETGSGDAAVRAAGLSLREQARHLEQNYDIARGALRILVANAIGPYGIGIEPQPRARGGDLHDDFARQLLALWRDWKRLPEVTWGHDWAATQRMVAKSWIRDGEVLVQLLQGPVPLLDHGTKVPFSLEMIEADFLPMSYDDINANITQGVERNAWGRPSGYWIYKTHPGDRTRYLTTNNDLKRVPADRMLHIKMTDRIRQARGVSVFASVLARLDDIKDYEESERVAAKVAAHMSAAIKKGTPDLYTGPPTTDAQGNPIQPPPNREIKFKPGMIFDDLRPGESIETIDPSRPNPQLESFRQGQLRAAASGIGSTYSSLSKDYSGTYSSQRQELVEGWADYGVLAAEFVHQFVEPVWTSFVYVATTSGALRVPRDVDPDSVDDALYIPNQMPWIDPEKEANAWEKLELLCYASGPEIIRRRGMSPREVLEQEANWRRQRQEKGVPLLLDVKGNPIWSSDDATTQAA